MQEKHPFHSDEAFVKGANPLQEFVDPAHEVTEEERNRPRYGRPARKPATEPAGQPKQDESPRPAES
jgi:hypothetical protein